MRVLPPVTVLGALLAPTCAFQPMQRRALISSRARATAFPEFVPAEPAEQIQDLDARNMLSDLQRVALAVPAEVSAAGTVPSSFYASPAVEQRSDDTPPLVLLHGFDSSCLEFRRLAPRLEALGLPFYAVDVLGWGFTDARGADCSAKGKLAHLKAFVDQVAGGGPVALLGASLGGALAIEFAAAYPDDVSQLVLVDAQGFIDGAGPGAALPGFLARLGIRVLGSPALRSMANDMSYTDKAKFATEDAMLVGRLHVNLPGWEDSNLAYMTSGGFSPSTKVAQVACPTLVLWGRDDKILDPALYAARFVEEMPDARLAWVDACGHVPHLEQPQVAATAIHGFLSSAEGPP